jgi:hypothetical protein
MTMNNFNRTAFNAEKDFRYKRKENDIKYCNEEISSSINHLLISFEKYIEHKDLNIDKEHIDNVYYHIGKIKGLL